MMLDEFKHKKFNDGLGSFFSTHRGVRQEEPMSPTLFNLTVDSMRIMIRNAQYKN
jgi:hypothetical protein